MLNSYTAFSRWITYPIIWLQQVRTSGTPWYISRSTCYAGVAAMRPKLRWNRNRLIGMSYGLCIRSRRAFSLHRSTSFAAAKWRDYSWCCKSLSINLNLNKTERANSVCFWLKGRGRKQALGFGTTAWARKTLCWKQRWLDSREQSRQDISRMQF